MNNLAKKILSFLIAVAMIFGMATAEIAKFDFGGVMLKAEAASTTPKVTINTDNENYKVEKTNAVLCADLYNPQKAKLEKVGIKLYDETGNLLKEHSERGQFNTVNVSIWFDVNSEVGYKLSEGKLYIYQMYAVVAGKTYTSETTYFKTKGTGVSIDTFSEHYKVEKTNAVLCAQVANSSKSKIAKVGIKLYDASGKLLKDHSEPGQYSNSTVYVWFDVKSEIGYSLSPGTTYKYQLYAVINGKTYTTLMCTLKTVASAGNIYNLGEETYSFKNYYDSDAQGHCFGMSITSGAYYLGELEVSRVSGSNTKSIYSLSDTLNVRGPICYYQAIQGDYSLQATVAGGSFYKYQKYNIESDWNEVINYVKDHSYDNKGSLQIGFRKRGEGGHAINFLRYEEINGQQRIYAYDNNCPEKETYFYKDKNGDIKQANYSTFSGSIDCIALRSIKKYFSIVDDFDLTRYIYAKKDSISISGINEQPIDCGVEMGETVVFKIPKETEKVAIVPLVEKASFTYLDDVFSFDLNTDDSIGYLTLSSLDENGVTEPDFKIVNVGIDIHTPSTTTISIGDSIILHADTTSNLPEGASIQWFADNSCFKMDVSSDSSSCIITPSSSGNTTFTVKIVSADGMVISEDTQIMTSKASFFDKIIAFFKGIFGLTKTIPQFIKNVF